MIDIKKNVAIFLEKITGIPNGIFSYSFIWCEELMIDRSDLSIMREDIFEEYGIKIPYKILETGSIDSVGDYISQNLPI